LSKGTVLAAALASLAIHDLEFHADARDCEDHVEVRLVRRVSFGILLFALAPGRLVSLLGCLVLVGAICVVDEPLFQHGLLTSDEDSLPTNLCYCMGMEFKQSFHTIMSVIEVTA
jgi:hypothetical protein